MAKRHLDQFGGIDRNYSKWHGMHSFCSYQTMMDNFHQFNRTYTFRWRKTQQQGKMLLDPRNVPRFLKGKRNLNWSSRGRKAKGVDLRFDGTPYIIVGREFYICHQGPDVDRLQKEKKRQKESIKIQQDPTQTVKRRNRFQMTKKKDCPATIEMLHIIKLPDFKIPRNSRWCRTQASQKFHLDLEFSDLDRIAKWDLKHEYHIHLPSKHEHKGHPVIKLTTEHDHVTDVKRSRMLLFNNGAGNVKCQLGDPTDGILSSVYPDDATDDQGTDWLLPNNPNILAGAEENDKGSFQLLQQQCKDWIPDKDRYLVREPGIQGGGEKENFLFVYQSYWQQRLLSLYGGEVCFVDAGHRTCKFPLPTFFLRVKTNVCHLVVGIFICENEDADSIKEALLVFSCWNEKWLPKNFLVDFTLLQTKAVEAVFTECNVYISDFYRERAWSEWLSQERNHLNEVKGEILKLLRAVARSVSPSNYETARKQLHQSKWWNNYPVLQTYYNTLWQPVKEKWVPAFRDETMNLLVLSRVGSEKENDWLKEGLFHENCQVELMCLVKVLVNEFTPKSYRKYVELNLQSSEGYKNYHDSVPEFLRNRPKYLVNHIMKRISCAIDPNSISQLTAQHFEVPIAAGHQEYVAAYLGEDDSMPYCSCLDWVKSKLPCKHLIKIITEKLGYGWNSFCRLYGDSPYFKLDGEVIQDLRDHEVHSEEEAEFASVVDHNACDSTGPDGDYLITILPKTEPLPPPVSQRESVLQKWGLILEGIHLLEDDKLEQLDTHFSGILSYIRACNADR